MSEYKYYISKSDPSFYLWRAGPGNLVFGYPIGIGFKRPSKWTKMYVGASDVAAASDLTEITEEQAKVVLAKARLLA